MTPTVVPTYLGKFLSTIVLLPLSLAEVLRRVSMNREPAELAASVICSQQQQYPSTYTLCSAAAAAAAGCACGPHVMSCHLSPRVCAVEEESDVS